MSESENSPIRAFEGSHKLDPITLPLHEAIALMLLFEKADTELVQSLHAGNVYYGFSAAKLYLRVRREVARLFGDEESEDKIAAEVAMLDQVQEEWSSS